MTQPQPTTPNPSRRSLYGLDWLNFFIADVQAGFGVFIAVYLAQQNWTAGEIGVVLTAGGIASVVWQTPGGALIDHAAKKRVLVAACLAAIDAAAVIFALAPSFGLVLLASILHGMASGMLPPAIAAITLGLVGHAALARRLGRNRRFEAAGTLVAAGAMGAAGHVFGARVIFLAAAALTVPAAIALASIRGGEIDYSRARSAADHTQPRKAERLRGVARRRGLWVFIVCIALFQLANASMMPLAAQRLAHDGTSGPTLISSIMIIVPQLVTVAFAGWVAAEADDWGRKPLLLIGYAALPIRAALFTVIADPTVLSVLQVLDGISATVIGVLTPLVVADLTRGTGRFNVAQGAVGTAVGVGAAASTSLSGYVVQLFGYPVGFAVLAVLAAAAFAGVWLAMPETRPADAAPARTPRSVGAMRGLMTTAVGRARLRSRSS